MYLQAQVCNLNDVNSVAGPRFRYHSSGFQGEKFMKIFLDVLKIASSVF